MSGPGLRILFRLAGDRSKASSRVRGYWIAEALERLGHSTTLSVSAGKASYLRLAAQIPFHDVVIFQKTYSRYDPPLLNLCRRLGKRVFFDIDDAPSRAGAARADRSARRMMQLADGVLAGNRRLEAMAREAGGQPRLVPSGIKLSNYQVQGADEPKDGPEPVCLGWIGNGAHYADDLIEILRPALERAAAHRPLRFRLVGANGEPRLHTVFSDIPGLQAEIVDRIDWSSADAVAEAMAPFRIGLYPLQPGPFNDFKCGFKALEYMAAGLPVIASDAANHAEIVEDGVTGYLLRDPAEWADAILKLASDADLRRRMAQAGRAVVEDRFSTDRIAADLAQLFVERPVRPAEQTR